MRFCELKQKEVINICDCRRLGCIVDVEFSLKNCCITHFIVPVRSGICGILSREQEYIIPASCVRQIGPDIILVDIRDEDCLRKCDD